MTAFKNWIDNATQSEIDKLAVLASTSPAYLRHIATGRREASAEMAGRIEKGTATISREGLPAVKRGDLSDACKSCPYYKNGCGEK